MGIGREVADAYIDVHGDLTKFRRSLQGAAKDGRKAGAEAADSFSDGWAQRAEREWSRRYNSVLDAVYSNKKVDWDRMFSNFDAKDLDDARNKIREFMKEAKEFENLDISDDDYKRITAAIRGQVKVMKEQEKLAEENILNTKRAREEQERYNKSFAGMFKQSQLRNMEKDFGRIVESMRRMDWSDWMKGEDSLGEVRDRIDEVTQHMRQQGRVSDEESERIIRNVESHIRVEEDLRKTIRDSENESARAAAARKKALDDAREATIRAKEAQDRYNRSFGGMIGNAKLADLEDRYKKITNAIATSDWGPVAKGAENVKDFRRQVEMTANELKRQGRLSDTAYDRIISESRRAARFQNAFNIELDKSNSKFNLLRKGMDKLKNSWNGMDKTVKLVLTLIAAAAGPIATLGSGLASGATALVSSLGMAVTSLVPLVAGAGAFAVGIGLAVSAMDNVRAKFPGIDEAMKGIGRTWKHQAGEFGKEWGASLDGLLSSFNDKLARTDFGTPFGIAARDITNAFTDIVNGPAFNALLRAMESDLPAAMSGLGRGIAGVSSGLVSLIAGAAPAAKALGEDFAGWGSKIAASLEKARETGKLNEVFMRSRESLLAVLDAAGSVGSALGTMFAIGSESGDRMWRSLARVTDQFNAWMHTEAGRASMLQWFENGERIIRAMEPLAVGLAKALNGLVTDYSIAQFENLMSLLGDILPVLGEVLGVISDLGILNILAEAIKLVGDFLEPLLPPLRELARAVGPAVQEMLKELSPVFTELGEALVPLVQLVADFAVDAMPRLIPVVIDVVAALIPLIEVVAELAQMFADWAGDGHLDTIIVMVEGLGETLTGFADIATGALNIVIGLLTGDWDRAWSGAGQVVDGSTSVMGGMFKTTFGQAGQDIKQFAQDAAGNIGQFAKDSVTNVGAWAGDMGTKFDEAALAVGTFVSDTSSDFETWAGETYRNLVEGGTNAVNGAKQNWADLKADTWQTFADIGNNVNTTLDGFWTKFDETFPGTRELAASEWAQLKETIGTTTDQMSENWNSNWDAIKGKTEAVVGPMVETVRTKWDEMQVKTDETMAGMETIISTKWNTTKENFTTNVNGMKDSASEAWDNMSTYTSLKYEEMKGNVETTVNELKTNASNNWNELKTNTKNAIDPMVQDAKTSFSNMKGNVDTFINDAKNNMSRGWNNMLADAGRWGSGMKETVRQGVQDIMDWFIKLPNRIVTAVSNPQLLYNAGQGIMNSLLNGLKSLYNNVKSFVGDIANWIRDHKGPISYDKVLLVPAGKAIMSGLLTGLESKMPALESTVNGITETLANAVSSDVTSAARTGAQAVMNVMSAEFSSSKTYLMGVDAAKGLADGLSAGASQVKDAYGVLAAPVPPGTFTYRPGAADASAAAGAEAGAGAKIINIESGAVQVVAKSADPGIVANQLLDGLVNELP